MNPHVRALASLSLATLLAGRPLLAATTDGAETPQKLVARMKAAAEKEDMKEMLACVAPDDRAVFSMMMVLAAGMMVAFSEMGTGMAEGMVDAFSGEEGSKEPSQAKKPDPELEKSKAKVAAMKAEYEALLGKHGLGEIAKEGPGPADEAAAKKMFAKVDHALLLTDVMAFLDKHTDQKEKGDDDAGGAPSGGPFEASDFDLSKLKVEGDKAWIEGSKDMRFVKVDGRWFVTMPDMGAGAGPPEP